MSTNSNIEWTDATWNPVRGCMKVSPGCANCYAETFAERFRGVKGHPYEQGFDLRLVPEKLTEPLKWKTPKRIFVNSMSDLFQHGVPTEFIDRVFALMALSPQHTFQILTKRADQMRSYMTAPDVRARVSKIAAEMCGDPAPEMVVRFWPLLHVWLGVSVENQHFADERIPLLLQTPAAVRFISAEPLLAALDLRKYLESTTEVACCGSDGCEWCDGTGTAWRHLLHWVIVGGESSPKARSFDVAWARAIVQQCKAADVPVFVKQMGSRITGLNLEGPPYSSPPRREGFLIHWTCLADNTFGLCDRKGGEPSEWPEDLRVREFPRSAA